MMTGLVNQCAILIGGAGSRLGALTRDVPKPMLPIGGRPFLAHLLTKAAMSGMSRVVLLAGYRADVVQSWLDESGIAAGLGIRIDLSIEPEALGTGGAITFALDKLDDTFFLINGDTWFDFDWRLLADGDLGPLVMGLRQLDVADRYETVELEGNTIKRFSPRSENKGAGLINGGAYRIRKDALAWAPRLCSLETYILPELCRAGHLAGLVFAGDFIDIGLPSSYSAAETMFGRAT